MSVSVEVPKIGESVSTAIVAEWNKSEGDYVEADELLVELETDKINVPIHAPVAGRITAIKAETDAEVNVGDVIAVIEEGAAADGEAAPQQQKDGGGGEPRQAAAEADAAPSKQQHPQLLPAVARLVEENSLDPSRLEATGPGGRLTKGDVLAHLEARAAGGNQGAGARKQQQARADEPTQRPAQGAVAQEERKRMSKLRQTVARRLVEAQQTTAMLTTFNEVDMSAVMELRREYKESFLKRYDLKLGFMGFFIKAAVEALKAYPAVNAEIDGDEIVYKNYYHIGVAVGGGRGLVVPVIRNADGLSFAGVERTLNALVDKAVNNRLTLEELQGGTFTISNGGIYGSMLSTPILNPPQSGILGMHNIVERPVAIAGEVKIRPIMYLALSYDHRIIDGKEAVSFLYRIKECIEDPRRILLEV